MSPELVSILAVGVALAGLTLTGLRGVRTEMHAVRAEMNTVRVEMNALRTELNDVRKDVADLCERVARLEGLFEGFIQTQKAPANGPVSN